MSSRIFHQPESLDWKQAYMAAVLEKDRKRLPGLIQEANQKLSGRLREMRAAESFPWEEIEAIHDALYLLDALLSSLSYREETAEWNRSVDDG